MATMSLTFNLKHFKVFNKWVLILSRNSAVLYLDDLIEYSKVSEQYSNSSTRRMDKTYIHNYLITFDINIQGYIRYCSLVKKRGYDMKKNVSCVA